VAVSPLPRGLEVKTRIRFIIGGVMILGTATYLMASSVRETGMFVLSPTELSQRVASNPSFRNVGVKVEAQVVSGSIVKASNGREMTFLATDGETTMKVSYNKVPPDMFSDSAVVVISGTMDPSGTFAATTLLAKCASRFEVMPDSTNPRFRHPEGYKVPGKGAQ
jgi:cytochrome c-type biogenesis protein CcmE